MADKTEEIKAPELLMLLQDKESGYNWRQRRHPDWKENYTLYRDKVKTNRLTQRQSVNLPLMKTAVRTLLKDVDDMPVLYFQNRDNNKEAEAFKNEYWQWTVEQNKLDLQDLVDKRQVFLFGRSFTQWQIVDGRVKVTVQDPQDILVSRFCDPFDLHSSRFLIHTHIFVPLTSLKLNPDYDQEEVAKLEKWFASDMGIVKAADNLQMLVEKNQKMEDMGVPDVESPVLGETYVELDLHFRYRDNEKTEKGDSIPSQIFLYVSAEDQHLLLKGQKKPLEQLIGSTKDNYWRNHYPYVSWADDLERQDFWSDGVGDIVRVPNRVLNAWFSQMVENRTLKNFNMNLFDATIEGFEPGTFNPVPWGWYPVPGKPSEVWAPMQVADLSDSLDEMNFLLQMIEKATGATSTSQGVQTERKITLGEVELALGEAKERIKGMSKFYTPAWQEGGTMFEKLVEAAPEKLNAVKLYKGGRNTDRLFGREVSPSDWMTASGYQVKVWSQDEKNIQDTQTLEKLNAAKANMPDNPKLAELYQRKLLEFVGLKPEEINDIMEYEDQKREAILSTAEQGVFGSQMEGIMSPPVQGVMPTNVPARPMAQA